MRLQQRVVKFIRLAAVGGVLGVGLGVLRARLIAKNRATYGPEPLRNPS